MDFSKQKKAHEAANPTTPFVPSHVQVARNYYNFLVDIGKTYREGALRSFHANKIVHINDLFITHAHMDAMGGLDDLRELPVTILNEHDKPVRLPTRVFMDKETTNAIRSDFYS